MGPLSAHDARLGRDRAHDTGRDHGRPAVRASGPAALTRWLLVLGASALVGLAGAAVGVPSPALFAGLAVGLLVALRTRWTLDVPDAGSRLAQGILGVSLGVYVRSSTLTELAAHALPVLGVTLVTLAATIAAGLTLSRITAMDRATAAFGMIAGGASGIVSISRELGADERLVAVMQYLRVLIIVILAPLVAGIVGGTGSGGGGGVANAGAGVLHGLAFLVACLVVGMLLARLARLPAGSLLGPMLVAAAATLVGGGLAAPVPAVLLQAAYVGIGLAVGLRFTVASLRHAGRILAPALAGIVAILVLSAGLGLLLVPLAGVRPLDAYLATTPGGLYAVLAAASISGVDTTFVLAVHVLRLLVMLLAAPALARWMVGRAAPPDPG